MSDKKEDDGADDAGHQRRHEPTQKDGYLRKTTNNCGCTSSVADVDL